MSPTLRMWRRLLAVLAILFGLLNTANALNKGGDAAVFFEGGRRLLHAAPLYDGSSAADGFIGPPFQAMFFAPFAAVADASPLAAKLLWHALSLACLGLGIWASVRAVQAACAQSGIACPPWLPMLFAPLAAILLPLQTNFEHQNINTLLLALIALATWQLTIGSAVIAGLLIGTATALKAFPALLILYLALRRYWLATIAAIVSAFALTVVAPMLVYGVAGFADLARTFSRLGNSGWPIRGNNQSLIAALDRFTLDPLASGFDPAGVRVAAQAPLAMVLFGILAVLLAAGVVATIIRTPRGPAVVPREMAVVTVLAILLSPIAWDHYWTLMFPAFLGLYASRDDASLRGWKRYAFWVAALLTTGLSPLTLGRTGFAIARDLSVYTIAGIVLYVSLLSLSRGGSRGAVRAEH